MKLISNDVEIQANPAQVLTFISTPSNIEKILPLDKISDFKSDESMCSFKVQGGIIITLVQNGREGDTQLFLKSGEKSPFPFTLTIHAESTSNGTKGYIEFNGEVNAFLKMMVEKPLSALFNYMSDKLKEQF
jgi:carbon monoxide dehydrogenase subunit G